MLGFLVAEFGMERWLGWLNRRAISFSARLRSRSHEVSTSAASRVSVRKRFMGMRVVGASSYLLGCDVGVFRLSVFLILHH